jgi:membrane protein
MFGRKKKKKQAPAAEEEEVSSSTVAPRSEPDPFRDPGANRDPGAYTDVPKRTTVFVVRRTAREFTDDGATDLAAALTYYSVLALFPGLIALFSLLGVFGQGQESVDTIMEIIGPLITDPTTQQQVQDLLEGMATQQGAGLTLVLGLVGALWSASGYVGAFSRAMNRIYEVEEGRPFWRMRPMQLVVTVLSVTLCAVALVILVVSGPVAESIGKALGVGDDLVVIWGYAKWPVLALVVMLVVALLYYATPNVKLTKFRLISVGAFVAIVIWVLASVGFAFYVATFSSYNATYGSLAGAIVALLWLWITNLALLFGAELDAELERGRELQIGIAAEETLQLPVRDTRGIQKATARRNKDLVLQRDIRLAAAGPGDPADRPFGRR